MCAASATTGSAWAPERLGGAARLARAGPPRAPRQGRTAEPSRGRGRGSGTSRERIALYFGSGVRPRLRVDSRGRHEGHREDTPGRGDGAMRNRGIFALVALALVAALVVTLAYRRDSGPAQGREKVVAIFKTGAGSNAFWAAVVRGRRAGAKDFGLEVLHPRAARRDLRRRADRILRDAVAERPGGDRARGGRYPPPG